MIKKEILLAGQAVFTVHNNKGEHYTYRIQAGNVNELWGIRYFVQLLVGPNNEESYQYLGMLNTVNGTVRATAKSKFAADSKPFKVVNWALSQIVWLNRFQFLPEGYGIKLSNKCARCGRTLTTPQSIDLGIGPECAGQIGFNYEERKN